MHSGLVGSVQLVEGDASCVPPVLALLKKEGIEVQANPDLYVRTYTHFGIDEARELRERASLGALGEGRRVFVAVVPSMTNEAQNALLKTLEEPPGGAMFFFLHPSPQTLLPTLKSRAQILRLETQALGDIDAKKFIAATTEKRLDMLKPLLEKGDDDKRDLGAIIAFLCALERAFEKKPQREALHAIYRARAYIGDKGALVKPLLEQVALLVPKH